MKVITSHAFGLHGKVQHRSSERSLSRRKNLIRRRRQAQNPISETSTVWLWKTVPSWQRRGKKQQSTLPPIILVLPETNFRLVSKNKNLWNLSLQTARLLTLFTSWNFLQLLAFLIISTFSVLHAQALKHFHKVEKNKKIFHICWIPAVALWPMANSYSLLPPHS